MQGLLYPSCEASTHGLMDACVGIASRHVTPPVTSERRSAYAAPITLAARPRERHAARNSPRRVNRANCRQQSCRVQWTMRDPGSRHGMFMKAHRQRPPHFPGDHAHAEWRDHTLPYVIVAALIVLVITLIVWLVDPAPPKTITISAGPRDSSFLITANQYKKILARNGITAERAGVRRLGAEPAASAGPETACRSRARARRRGRRARHLVADVARQRVLCPGGRVLSRHVA